MKRKYIFGGCLVLVICYVALTILVVLSFRPPRPHERPYGTWRSDDPPITFTVVDRGVINRGVFQKYGNDVDIIVTFHATFKNFRILNQSALIEGGGIDGSYTYFSCRFEVIEDRMYYRLFPHIQELSGFDVIVFERVLED